MAGDKIASRLFSHTAARACVLAIVLLAPVATTLRIGALPLTHDSFELPKAVIVRVLTVLALALWAGAIHREKTPVRVSWWLLPVAVYVGWTVFATVFSPAPIVSLVGTHGRLDGLATVLTYGTLAFVALQTLSSGRHLISLARSATVSGAIVSIYAVLQILGFQPLTTVGGTEFTIARSFSTMGNPVFLGGLLILLLPMQAMTAMVSPQRAWRVVGLVASVTTTIAVIGTASRAAWLIGILEIAALVALLVVKRIRPRSSAVVAAAVGVAASAAVVIRSLRSSDPVMNVATRFSSILGGDGSSSERLMVIKMAARAMGDRPLFGFGPARFVQVFNRYRTPEHAEAFPLNSVDNAHNMVLQVGATTGVIAATAWLTASVWPLASSAKHVWSRDNGHERMMLSGLWLGVAGYVLFMMSGISVTGAAAIFWISLATLAGVSAKALTPSGRWLAVAPWALGATALLVSAWSVVLLGADNRYMLARERVRGDAPGDPLAATEKALALAPWDATYRRHVVLLTAGVDRQAAKNAAARVLSIEPDDVTTLVLLAKTHLELGELAEARVVVDRASQVAPLDPSVIGVAQMLGQPGP